ncbi:MAG: monovalent cation/H+ antiporter complex subunit F [Pseudomonadota bacterium]
MTFEILAAASLLATLGALPRLVSGPTAADRLLALQLGGTGTVATIIVLAAAGDDVALYDVALVFAILAAVAGIAFVALRGRTTRGHGIKARNQ